MECISPVGPPVLGPSLNLPCQGSRAGKDGRGCALPGSEVSEHCPRVAPEQWSRNRAPSSPLRGDGLQSARKDETRLQRELEARPTPGCLFLAVVQWASHFITGAWASSTICAVLSHFSHVQLFVTLWTVDCQAPLFMGLFQARILKWVVLSFSRGSSQPKD